ncbi:GNAT family N-acetyltransferase [Patescibacteria group bacterium]|nr:GNAT family N-acetyltransferase [Patescibacteria group bacterium]MCL5091406.1 GNAT family N-acetyltransferase [Patescibacteria group bacterium]
MPIIYKETKDLDYERVVDIFYSVKFLKHPHKRKIYKRAIEKAFRNSQYVVAAYDNDKLIAFVRVLTDKSLFATIWNLIVSPDYQIKGIGQTLVRRCLDKYPKLHFFTIADKSVYKFYEKMGFKIHSHGMYLEKGRKVCLIYN